MNLETKKKLRSAGSIQGLVGSGWVCCGESCCGQQKLGSQACR